MNELCNGCGAIHDNICELTCDVRGRGQYWCTEWQRWEIGKAENDVCGSGA